MNIWNACAPARRAGPPDLTCQVHIKGWFGKDDVEFDGAVNPETAAQVMCLVPGYSEELDAGPLEQRMRLDVLIRSAGAEEVAFSGVADRSLVTDMLRLATGGQEAVIPHGLASGVH